MMKSSNGMKLRSVTPPWKFKAKYIKLTGSRIKYINYWYLRMKQ